MPLMDGDIEVLSLANRSHSPLGWGRAVPCKEIIFRVRGHEERVYIPLSMYTKEVGDQEIIRAAADIVDLLDKYPARG